MLSSKLSYWFFCPPCTPSSRNTNGATRGSGAAPVRRPQLEGKYRNMRVLALSITEASLAGCYSTRSPRVRGRFSVASLQGPGQVVRPPPRMEEGREEGRDLNLEFVRLLR